MPFLRSWTLRPAVATALAALVLTAVAAPTAARAEDTGAAAPATPEAVTPTSTATPPATDAADFCTRPTGRWWEDYAADGCAARVAGRTAADPLTPTELSWLDLGDLPAHADVDVAAIGAALDAYARRLEEERLAAEAAARAEAEARAAALAAAEAAAKAEQQRNRGRRVRELPSMAEIIAAKEACGIEHWNTLDRVEQACVEAEFARTADARVFRGPAGPGFGPQPAGWHDTMLVAVNRERASVGSAPVRSCPSLTRTAQDYAEVLRDWGQIDHQGPDGSWPFDRAIRGGYSIRVETGPGAFMVDGMVGENLAAGYVSAEHAVFGWMDSPGHRNNLLDSGWTDAGFGVVAAAPGDPYGYYWVQLFGDGTGNC